MSRAARGAVLSKVSKRVHAQQQTRLGPLIDTLPYRLELPPIVLARGEELTDEQISAGVLDEYGTI